MSGHYLAERTCSVCGQTQMVTHGSCMNERDDVIQAIRGYLEFRDAVDLDDEETVAALPRDVVKALERADVLADTARDALGIQRFEL